MSDHRLPFGALGGMIIRIRIIHDHPSLLTLFRGFGPVNPPRVLFGVFPLDYVRLDHIKLLEDWVDTFPSGSGLPRYILLLLTTATSRGGFRDGVLELVGAKDDKGIGWTRDVLNGGNTSFSFDLVGHC